VTDHSPVKGVVSVNKSQVSGFLVNLFSKISSLWILKEIPNLNAAVSALEAKVSTENDAILARLPATFTPKDVVDVVFSLAETWLPQYLVMLKWAQGLVDALLQTPPVVPPAA
jgi:hypothetical protein